MTRKSLHRPGIEPGPPAWQASILPLNQRCYTWKLIETPNTSKFWKCQSLCLNKKLSQLVGFEPTLPEGNWFRVSRLNHSATTATTSDPLKAKPKKTNPKFYQCQKVYSIVYSQAVTHPSTNTTQCCLTSVIRRELVFSTWYGRRQVTEVLRYIMFGLNGPELRFHRISVHHDSKTIEFKTWDSWRECRLLLGMKIPGILWVHFE